MDRRSTELSKVIRNTLEQTVCLELLPRSQIDVYVQVGMGRRCRWQVPGRARDWRCGGLTKPIQASPGACTVHMLRALRAEPGTVCTCWSSCDRGCTATLMYALCLLLRQSLCCQAVRAGAQLCKLSF